MRVVTVFAIIQKKIPKINIDLINPENLAFVLFLEYKGIASNSSTMK